MKVINSGNTAVCLGVSAYFKKIQYENSNISYDDLSVSYNPYSSKKFLFDSLGQDVQFFQVETVEVCNLAQH